MFVKINLSIWCICNEIQMKGQFGASRCRYKTTDDNVFQQQDTRLRVSQYMKIHLYLHDN